MNAIRSTVWNMVTARLPRPSGEYRLSLFHNDLDGKEHLALVRGDVAGRREVLVRIHSECFTGDVLGSERCDCGDQLSSAFEKIDLEGRGAVLYLRQEGRGIGLLEKLKAYNLQDLGYDTVDANRLLGHAPDAREYEVAARMLEQLEIRSVRLLTNNPAKIAGLEKHGVEVCGRVPIGPKVKKENAAYLRTKVERLQHRLDLEALLPGEGVPETPAPAVLPLAGPAPLEGHWAEDLLNGMDPAPAGGKRPFVTLTYAQSVDGCIAESQGQPLAISGPQSRAFTHQLRAAHDAILVGIGTVLTDDPRLTVRLVEAPRDPRPVVLDSRLRFPASARLLAGPGPWIATAEDADPERQALLEAAGAKVLRLPLSSPGRIDLERLLAELAEKGVKSLMVEGGATVISSFLAARLVDHLVVTVAPMLVGGLPAVARKDRRNCPGLPRLRAARYRQLGDDMIIWGAPDWS
jgi:GTP cyclohydrolase II